MKIILLATFLFLSGWLSAQQLSVKSFRKLENDLSARVANRMDQNGDVCAVIKVVSPEKGFFFDGDGNGIVSIEKKIGEYWIYLPYGSRFLTVKHERLGILRAYPYPERIDKACVYEMVLTTGSTVIEGKEKDNTGEKTADPKVISSPEGAIGVSESEAFQCGGLLVDRRDGQKYRIRLLADGHCWMVENLRFGKCRGAYFDTYNGRSRQKRLASGYWGVCIASEKKNGGNLYNWQAAMNSESAEYNTSGNPSGNVDGRSPKQWQGICPEGWHLPSGGSSGEFQRLYEAYDGQESKIYPGEGAFEGVLGGFGNVNSVIGAGSQGRYWSSTYGSTTYAYSLYFNSGYVNPQNYNYKEFGFAVRCVKDY